MHVLYLTNGLIYVVFFNSEYDVLWMTKIIKTQVKKQKKWESRVVTEVPNADWQSLKKINNQ